MIADTKKKRVLRFAAFLLLAAMLLTSCASAGKSTTVSQLQLGQKYLSEMNYSEAIAAFTEAIRLDPNDIQAYLGRAQAYEALEKYEEARDDYTAVIEKAGEMPYTQAQAYAGRAEINETLDEPVSAELDYSKALSLLEKDGTGDAENIGQETVTALLMQGKPRPAGRPLRRKKQRQIPAKKNRRLLPPAYLPAHPRPRKRRKNRLLRSLRHLRWSRKQVILQRTAAWTMAIRMER